MRFANIPKSMTSLINNFMEFTYKNNIEIVLKKLNDFPDLNIDNLIKGKNLQLFDKNFAFSIDIENLSIDEQTLLFDEGDCIPRFLHYWLNLFFEIKKIVNKKNWSSFWINSHKNEYYDDALDTFLELYLSTISNGAQAGDIFFVWGDITQKELPKKISGLKGFVMPILDGHGVIMSLENDVYNLLKPILHIE